MTPSNTLILDVLVGERTALIRDEVRAAKQRGRLEDGARDAMLKLGYSIDEVSEATGLTPDELRVIASTPPELDLDVLAGLVV